jgi:anaerobic selenocysteine-containing dehydrogenase
VSWDDVLKMNPADGAKLGLKTGDMVKVTSPPAHHRQAQAVGRRASRHRDQVLRPGPLGLRPRGAKDYGKAPRGGNNNESWSTTTTA